VPALADRLGLLGLLAHFLPDPDLAQPRRERVPLLGAQMLIAEEDDPVLGPGAQDRLIGLVRVLPGQVETANLRADQPAGLVHLRHRHRLHVVIIGQDRRPR
jgi:hypothetical protein